jgi:RHH-type proline utilization regulon transcriptional repressor/proline dehydrogenase/delta 1-pyrroline-5-carboxylate dehydrogenase
MNSNLSSLLYADETKTVDALIQGLSWDKPFAHRIEDRASDLILRIRSEKIPAGQLETFLQEYSLSTDEGIALMCLAEALLRIPDKATARALIRDKVGSANWSGADSNSKKNIKKDWIVKAAGLGLLVTSKTLDSALARIGEPVIHGAMAKAMGIMGRQFVLGHDIEAAVQNAIPYQNKGYRMSYDMLGEGARTHIDADRYFLNYANAIRYIGERKTTDGNVPGISVKLSALHPRYSFAQKDRCVPELIERLVELCRLAAERNVPLTVDAEETERLEISLDVITGVLRDQSFPGWEGFGLAVQAYQKRAYALLDELVEVAKMHRRRLQVRLVKGAYWDSQIKKAQVAGMPEYPVFTRKDNTDISYLACAQKMLAHRDRFYPMFGTHNAATAAAIIEMAKEAQGEFEFQRLYGMGESLYAILLRDNAAKVRIYAPVGPQEDLLAYLVRRLLENGANTSFVNQLMDSSEPMDNLVRDPVEKTRQRADKRHSRIPLPRDLYAHEKPDGRINSSGMDLNDMPTVAMLQRDFKHFHRPYESYPLIGGRVYRDTLPMEMKNPGNLTDTVGRVWFGNKGLADKAMRVAGEGLEKWSRTDPHKRAKCLERYADLLEKHRSELMALCVRETGKTLPDALAEVREAVDFARYYANRGREDFFDKTLPGPTGESNILRLEGRGIFVCISPWNFPLAIFSGQITAALMAGNTVVAKPAEQTPLIAMLAVRLLHEAGVPGEALNLVPGDGAVGAALVQHKDVAGVAFTGSTDVAWEINKTLAAKRGPIVPLIAETGGMNAMIVDSSALPEQVIDDALLSAFGTAGQRCSALRILCVQNDCADKIIRMLDGAMRELRVGDPALLSTDVGPVIDDEARRKLVIHREGLKGYGSLIHEISLDKSLKNMGHYFAPCAFELSNLAGLTQEVFGPILHVVRYERSKIADLVDELNEKDYGLTLGVHSRIDEFQDYIATHVRAGNVYINRSITGAVVGTQPFGGMGISGTGPKAGGPHYLARFASERTITANTTAAGGNASLVSLEE